MAKATPPAPVQVEIFGQSYAMRAGTDPEYLGRLAGYVDGHMREIARSGAAVDSVRIAVLAALQIADECFQAKAAVEGASGAAREAEERIGAQVSGRAQALAAELDDALRG